MYVDFSHASIWSLCMLRSTRFNVFFIFYFILLFILCFPFYISLLMLNMCNSIEDILIVVMSILSFYIFTNACHCKVYLFAYLR